MGILWRSATGAVHRRCTVRDCSIIAVLMTDTPSPTAHPRPIWDIFCQVIDNFGDIGVCWRLACNLAARGQQVRLRVDDASALQWMAPAGAEHISVLPWPQQLSPQEQTQLQNEPPQVVVEAFGCYPPEAYIAALARQVGTGKPPVWINLEYLSAEDYVARMHRLPSPISFGPAAGWTRWFFYPGFTANTGGLLRETDLTERQQHFDRQHWRAARHVQAEQTLVSLFCYEPPGLASWWAALQQSPLATQTSVAVTPGRAERAMQQLPGNGDLVQRIPLTATDQAGFDELLWASDLNMVRGEDSLVRALWAGQPLVWHIYPQEDDAHHDKLRAFLDWLQAPDSLRQWHALWNGVPAAALGLKTQSATWPLLSPRLLQEWRACVLAARSQLQAQASLADQLIAFAAEKG